MQLRIRGAPWSSGPSFSHLNRSCCAPRGPGSPIRGSRAPFLLLRAKGGGRRWISVLSLAPVGGTSPEVKFLEGNEQIEVTAPGGVFRYHLSESGVTVEHANQRRTLGGLRGAPPKRRPFFEPKDEAALAFAPFIHAPPALDGTLAGFDTDAPLDLDAEHQYRRSEEPYDPEARFSARAWINWDGEALYLAVAVTKPEVVLRPADAASRELDNEPEDINSDGLQIYLGIDGAVEAVIVTPQDGGGLAARRLGVSAGAEITVAGTWNPTEFGYLVTIRVFDERLAGNISGARLGFDLLVNEMHSDRLHRAGQLVWSGGGGWIYLRGDRHDPSQLGTLELG